MFGKVLTRQLSLDEIVTLLANSYLKERPFSYLLRRADCAIRFGATNSRWQA